MTIEERLDKLEREVAEMKGQEREVNATLFKLLQARGLSSTLEATDEGARLTLFGNDPFA